MNSNRGIEENTSAIIDSFGVKDARDIEDDRLSFLQAVRVTSIVPENGTVPSSKMFEAIFQIMRNGTTLELIITSYQLLIELEKRYPRVYLSNSELVVDKEAWSPFSFGSEGAYSDRNSTNGDLDEPLNPNGFFLLAQVADTGFKLSGIKPLADMFLFQYLIRVLERDFLPRNSVYKESSEWSLLRESLLNTLMGSRRINYRNLFKDCLYILCKGSHAGFDIPDGESAVKSSTQASGGMVGPTILSEFGKRTVVAVQIFLTSILELVVSKKQADMKGETSRADGVRVPLMDIIVDELTYNKDLISPFLQVFSESQWKLDIILQYFEKYVPKTSLQTRRSNNSPEVSKLDVVLKCFSNVASTRGIVKKINVEVAQLLLAHAFQAYTCEKADDSSLVQVCKDISAAFQNLRKIDEDMEMLQIAEEALFTVATILSTK
ncbi:negative regulator of systemic acquired resistance SNI1-like isoform X2 [Papaver somniferum]|uniref:negative regulator of systemic acquired resistance SNI1-like isoform X2 n=1 Tax=Papaver somniferum TaxID=3469 RepID=UPI000E6FD996|nr:negative regulator of systemic acquired resistance SNI1-like isoform X2 [Papaver somniferum]